MITYPTNKLQKVLLGGGCEQRNLPSGYTQVEYLESAGTQWIDTGYYPNPNTKFEISGTQSGTDSVLFGLSSVLYCFDNMTATHYGFCGYMGYFDCVMRNVPVVLTMSVSDGIVINGTKYTDLDVRSEIASYPMALFGRRNNNSGDIAKLGNHKINYAKVYENNILLHNYIPCKRNSDNVLGMFDLVSQTFLTNAGTGTFTAGPDAVPTPYNPMDIVCNNGVVKVSKNLFNKNSTWINYNVEADYVAISVPNGTYTCSTSIPGTSSSANAWFDNQHEIFSSGTNPVKSEVKRTVIVTEGALYFAVRRNYKDSLLSGQYWVQIEQGSTETPYIPYGKIYTDGTVETVKSTGKNLLDTTSIITDYRLSWGLDTATYGINDIVIAIGYYTSNLISVEVGKTYIKNSPVADVYHRFKVYDSNQVSVRVSSENSVTIQTGEAYIAFCGLQTELTTAYCVELSTATAEMLLSIGSYKDTQSVLDGKVTRNVGIKVLNGTESWTYEPAYSRFYTGDITPLSIVESGVRVIPAHCTHFKILSNQEPIADVTIGQGYFRRNSASDDTRIYLHSDKTTVSDFTQFLADQYAQGTPVTVIYPLETPTNEQVTPQPLVGNTATVTAGSIDNLPIKADIHANMKHRFITDTNGRNRLVNKVYIGSNLVFEEKYLVDMGLPSGTLWATRNIDVTQADGFAASPYQYECSFFSWGNVDGHNPTSDSSFSPHNWGNVNSQSPYYENQVYGSTQGNTLTNDIPVGVEFDAAKANLGGPWRMPTVEEFKELFDNCDFIDADGNIVTESTNVAGTAADKRITMNDTVGLRIRSKINGNVIFFPASGGGSQTAWYNRGTFGNYWSSSRGSSRNSFGLSFDPNGTKPQDALSRYVGRAVRPVI